MDGLLIIDKPGGMTSHDVVGRVRRILGTRRVGHTGTLDPFATGVMVILVGRATRLAQFLDKDEKEYEALVRFGFETDTGDRTGERRDAEADRLASTLTADEVEAALVGFRGEIEQVPPMYSAKKIDGKKMYELARKGQTVERKAVRVRISELELLAPPEITNETVRSPLRVVCSAGTYIRTLAEELGRKLGTLAHLDELRRTRSGRFAIAESLTLEELASLEDPESHLVGMERAVSHLPRFKLTEERVAKTRNGMSTRVFDHSFTDGEVVAMFDPGGELVAVGRFGADENSVRPTVVLV